MPADSRLAAVRVPVARSGSSTANTSGPSGLQVAIVLGYAEAGEPTVAA
ncbi:MAG: hypothetical protein JWR70_2457, partial [Modestobacter sp.]|nr:hypothetical protein [Modestobacter sp.]